jgi:replicative DNA helicase
MFSTDYELALVANLFHKPNNINKVRGMLLGSEFYSNDLGIAFTKLIDMNNAGLPINKVTLETELKKSGKANNLTALNEQERQEKLKSGVKFDEGVCL